MADDPSHGGNLPTDFTTCREENNPPLDETESDFSAAALNYIDNMLMKENIEEEYNILQDSLALQAAEKSLYDAIGESYPSSASTLPSSTTSIQQHLLQNYPNVESPGDSNSSASSGSTFATTNTTSSADSFWSGFDLSMIPLMPNTLPFPDNSNFQSNPSSITPQSYHTGSDFTATNNDSGLGQVVIKTEEIDYDFDEEEEEEVQFLADATGSSCRQSALYMDDTELSEFFDKVLLGTGLGTSKSEEEVPKDSRGNKSRARKRKEKNDEEVIDLRTLLMQCAQAVSSDNRPMAKELLMQIKLHSSPTGDATQRLSHCFANALEARMAGTGTHIHSALSTNRPSTSDMVKAYQMYTSACPFDKFGIRFSINSIYNLAKENVHTIHIVEFGIRYGFKWPGFISRLSNRLSNRPGGPPKLRITGIEYPLPGLKLEETGQCLARYCERFKVPFEFNAIVAKKWERIKVEDLKLRENEFVAVNCMYRFENLLDETVMLENPRDSVLELIRKANPNIFVHGIVSGKYDAAFFLTRFKEAMFHYSALFDMLDNTVGRDDPMRLMFEEAIFGKEAMSVVACEGNDRIERPHSYKKWQVKNTRAGFRQLPLDEQVIEMFKGLLVDEGYHRDFMLHSDGKWLLQGWKGRILYASSCWVPA
ncbi:hypothetical protein PIB30_008246 [Stylosanthes scabra]|uniref:Uncharacterized protein n=1 Tax=Stylosanthes scabra TaxID=79078 RepID=A0ABU6R3N9_9FABA|nr:hypothetical protein [Stylosanthes scabra]